MNKISIIIPVLNEADTIENLINYLLKNSSKENISEIIIVDGGSTDASKEMIHKFKNVEFISSEKGRAKQMNLGAKTATGNIFYFLHADSFPPKDFDAFIIDEVSNGHFAGCFRMQFDSNHWWLRFASWLTQFNWNICRGGDQSLFITNSIFEKVKGFNENYIIYEDNDLIEKLYKIKQFVVIKKWLITSARRYNTNGVWRLQYHFFVIHLKKWFGTSAENLNSYYKKNITN